MSYSDHRMRFNDQPRGSAIVLNLLIANVLVFILQQVSAHLDVGLLYQYLPLYSLQTPFGQFYPWQLLTYGFMHGGFTHILFNMIVLWMFGRILAADFGEKRFLIYFLSCIVGGGLIQLLIAPIFGPFNVVLGASGGTMGLLVAFGWRYPKLEIMLLFPPIPVKARNLVIFLALFDIIGGIGGGPFGIAHFAHIGGLLTGLLLMAYWRGKLPLQPKNLLP